MVVRVSLWTGVRSILSPRLRMPMAPMADSIRYGSDVRIAANGDPSIFKEAWRDEGKPNAPSVPKPTESPPITRYFAAALRSKEIRKATTPSTRSGTVGVRNIASTPTATMTAESTKFTLSPLNSIMLRIQPPHCCRE